MTEPLSPELQERCVALVRRMAGDEGASVYPAATEPQGHLTPHYQEARKIRELLPKPVDPDRKHAQSVVADCGWVDEDVGYDACVEAVLAGIERGRALAEQGK